MEAWPAYSLIPLASHKKAQKAQVGLRGVMVKDYFENR
jgi:hypothetical protein